MSGSVWITGVSGFTGRHLVGFLRSTPSPPRLVGIDVVRVTLAGVDAAHTIDLTDAAAVAALGAAEPPRWVIHLAGLMPPAPEPDMWRANVGGTVGLLLGLRASAARRARIVSIGSAAEYRPDAPSPLNESAPCGGSSAYGNSKLAQSLTCLRLAADCELEAMVARPFNLVGPGLPPKLIAGALVQQFASAGPLDSVRVGNTHTARDFVDVRDAVRAYWLLALGGEAGAVYNISSDAPVSIGHLLSTLQRVSGRSPRIEVDPSRVRPNDPASVFGDSSRLRRATGWRPEIPLEQSLRDMLAHV